MKKTYLVAGSAPMAAALALTACGSSSDEGSGGAHGDTYQVVVVAAQSGPLAVNGTSYLRGLRVAADELNAKGGVLGKKVVVTALDSQGDATKAVSVLRGRLSKGAKPDLVIDGTISNETVALLPILTREKVLSCGVTLTAKANQPKVYPYSFHVANHATDQAKAIAVKLKAAGYKKIGLFQQNDANGQTSQQGYQDALGAAGLTTVTETYDPTALDMTAPLQRLAAKHTDAIIVTANGPASPYVLQSRLKAGITIPTFLDTSVITDIASLVPAAALKGVSLFTFAINKFIPEADRTPAEKSWYSGLASSGKISQIFFVYAASHDCLQLAAAATTQAKSFDGPKVATAEENLTISGDKPYVSFKDIKFSPADHFVSATTDDYAVITPIPKVSEGTWKPATAG